MFSHAANSARLLHEGRDAPKRDVSRATFIRACRQSGMTLQKARFHAGIAEGLGSHALIGGVKLRIVRKPLPAKGERGRNA